MAILFESWITTAALLLLSIFAAAYLYYWKQFRYWATLRVPHTKPRFPMGDYTGAGYSKHFGIITHEIYKSFPKEKFVGFWMFFRPTLLVRDPELIKNIMVKDFAHFRDRGVYVNEKEDPLGAHLFSIGGAKWRNLRTKISPTFTSGKMKMMFPAILDVSKEMVSVLEDAVEKRGSVEVKDLTARFTTDVISTCAFGIQTNSLRNPNAIFRVMGRKVFELGIVPTARLAIPTLVPKLAELIQIRFVAKDVADFFLKAVRETMDFRKNNDVKRNDFMQLLIQLMNKGYIEDVDEPRKNINEQERIKMTFEDAAAQAFVFFIAGFETSSTTIQFLLYELALNHDIQERCRAEIRSVMAKHGKELTYEGIFEMEYTGRVVDEVLRKYPVVTQLSRECNQNYKIPDSDIVIEKGTSIQISTLGLHYDPQNFPDPEKFDPDRFLDEEKAKRHHYSYLPFGEGPRNCIGMRFGLMSVKVGVISLLTNYKFDVAKETAIPLRISPKQFIYTTDTGITLSIARAN